MSLIRLARALLAVIALALLCACSSTPVQPASPVFDITLDGRTFTASQSEREAYLGAVRELRAGHFAVAESRLRDFAHQYPSSGYGLRASYWMANAQFGQRQFETAKDSFGKLFASLPSDHPLRPEVLLSLANCQLELASRNEAQQTLTRLVNSYPQSDAARLARDRLRSWQ
jgi:tol-pal system protein YbgF